MLALPFGASRSVYSFLRVAHSIWWLGSRALALVWSSFFDDFITISRQADAEATQMTAMLFFRLLGWRVSGGDKDVPFAGSFKALGVKINFCKWLKGVVQFSNTPKKVDELVGTINQILECGQLSPAAALSLRGRMQFARAQLWGRAGRVCLNLITKHAYSNSGAKIPRDTAAALSTFCELLKNNRPRLIRSTWSENYIIDRKSVV